MTTSGSDYREDGPGGLDAMRQDTIDRLTEAFAADLIDMDEYERRAEAANAAKRTDDLRALSADLPVPRRAGPAAKRGPSTEPAFSPRRALDPSIVGAAPITTGCVMGDRRLVGDWLSSDRVSAFTVMGSTRLDLREAVLPPGPIRIEAFTLMGEIQVIVPRDLPVKLNAFAFMGESNAGKEVNQQIRGAETWVEVSGFAMMGSLTVKARD